jgi:hypothetical protein
MTFPSKPMLTCGHIANARRYVDQDREQWLHACAICNCTDIDPEQPHLDDRKARCYCGEQSERNSSDHQKLAFFEYRGKGSPWAVSHCRCGYAKNAHRDELTHVMQHCAKKNGQPGFIERGPHEFDNYYCGCRGWD